LWQFGARWRTVGEPLMRRLALPLLSALVLAGCQEHATIRSISGSQNPSTGGTPLTFVGHIGSDNNQPQPFGSTWTSSDNPDVAFGVDEAPREQWVFHHTFAVLPAGTQATYRVHVDPAAGADKAGASFDETIVGGTGSPGPGPGPGPGPPSGLSAAFTYDPPDPFVDERVTFDSASTTDNGGRINGWAWHFDPDASVIGPTNSNMAKASFQTAGTHTVSLTVNDDQGRASTVSHDVTVQNGVRPKRAARGVFAAATPAVSLSTSPNPAAQAVTHLFANLPQGTGKVRSYRWDFGGGRFVATTRTPTAAHVFKRAGAPLVRMQARLAGGGTLNASSPIAIAKAAVPARGTVAQPFLAQIASSTAARPGVHDLLGSLGAGSRKHGARTLADSGSFRLQAIDAFRPGAAQLLAPLLSATTRGATHIDLARRAFRATYLLSSSATGSRTCLGVVVHYSAAGAHGTLKALGGTGLSRRLHLNGSFRVVADMSFRTASLSGTMRASRGKPRGLPATCRALRR
jgi:PKD repeat protein